jgi:hypothetical protein
MEHSAEHYFRSSAPSGGNSNKLADKREPWTMQASLDKDVVVQGMADLVHLDVGGEGL